MLLAPLIPLSGGNPLVLVLVGLGGMISVTANESTGLQSLDQAILPATVSDRQRTSGFATYNLVASAAAAIGGLAIGPLVALGTALGQQGPARFGVCFLVYAGCGLIALVLARRLDEGVEAPTSGAPDARAPVGAPPRLSAGSRAAVRRLAGLFALDSLAGAFVVQSYLAYWFGTRHGLDAATVGVLFFLGLLLTAASFPAAAALAGRFGLIRTMVFTHIPSSLLLIAMAIVPDPAAAMVLYLCRASLASMDVPTRQSYTMAIVPAEDRTAAAGITNLARSGAQSAGPILAGAFLLPLGLAAPLIGSGVLKICYDLALFAAFRSTPAPEEAQ